MKSPFCVLLLPLAAIVSSYEIVDPVFTAYKSNGTVDYDTIPAYAKLCVENGVTTILLGGSTAEWSSLTAEERLKLLSEWRKAVDSLKIDKPASKPKILFHSGDISVANAQYLTSEAKVHGADEILIVSPCIMRPASLEDLVKTIKSIAGQSDLPAFYYHYPALYGVDFPMDQFVLLASQPESGIPTLKGVKFIDDDFTVLSNATGVAGGNYVFFNNDPLLAGMVAGSGGAISYTTIFPLVEKMREAFDSGNMEVARIAQRSVFKYDDIIHKYGGKPAARVLPQLVGGVDLGPPRPPLEPISQSNLAALRRDLIAAGFLKSAHSEM